MATAPLRYFGVQLAEVEPSGLRSDTAFGRFVPVADPLPVGTMLELDGIPHRVTRVEEGLTPGVWIWTDGAVHQPAADMPTSRDLPIQPEEAAPSSIEAQPTVPTPEADVPEPVAAEKSEDGGKKRRRRAKTTVGH